MTPDLPPALARAFAGGSPVRLADALVAMTEPERRAAGPAVVARSRIVEPWSDKAGLVVVLGFGCLPTAAQTAALVGRRSLRWAFRFHRDNVVGPAARRVLRARGVPWVADLAGRLADGLPARDVDPELWSLIADLCADSGAPTPTGDAFVRGWLARRIDWHRGAVVDRFVADPLFDRLVGRIFEVDGVGATLDAPPFRRGGAKPFSLLASVAAARGTDRVRLLDGCVGRLLRGDAPGSVRAFVRFHDDLAPTADELAPHTVDYLKLLPDAPGPVAALAQRALGALDDAGRLSGSDRLAASDAVCGRAEKSLVTAQLSRVDARARRDPAAGPLVATVAAAFGHDSLAVQDRAATVALRHAALLDDAGRGRIAGAAELLAADVRGRLADAFGVAPAVPAAPVSTVEVAAGPGGREMPAPIDSAAGLAAAVAAYLGRGVFDIDGVDLESLLDGLVRLTWADPGAVRSALAPVHARHEAVFRLPATVDRFYLPAQLVAALAAPLAEPAAPVPRSWFRRQMLGDGELGFPRSPGPERVLAARFAEIAAALPAAPVPFLLATPTRTTGHIAPAVLVDRVARYEAAGRVPLRHDFDQALLRLPWRRDDDAVAAADRLTSDAGRRLARWLRAGPPAVQPSPVDVRPMAGSLTTRPAVATSVAGDDLGPLHRAALTVTPAAVAWWGADFVAAWPMVAPSHREVVAAHLLQLGTAVLPAIAELDGPAGPAMPLALAYRFGARDLAATTAVIDAVGILAARGHLDPDALGVRVGELCGMGVVKVARVVSVLAEIGRAGDGALAARVALRALPAVLAMPVPPSGAAALLELAAKHATPALAVEVPGLDELAARTGSTRVVTEAQRLRRALGVA